MILYRIGVCNYVNDLSGAGTRLFGARWNSKGHPGIYLASSRALAVLEVLVHLQPLFVPDDYCLVEIEAPDDDLEIPDLSRLPSNWNDVSPPGELKAIGDDFFARRKHLILRLPSAIVPEEFNFLVNPVHPAINGVRILRSEPFSFDERLIKRI